MTSTLLKNPPIETRTAYPQFVLGYLQAIMIAGQTFGKRPLHGLTHQAFTPAAFDQMVIDCDSFILRAGKGFDALVGDRQQLFNAGYDFWFVRNKLHGGFFDPEVYGQTLSQCLQAASAYFRPIKISEQEDGKLQYLPLLVTASKT